MRRALLLVLVGVGGLGAGGCLTAPERGTPLYSPGAAPPTVGEVATLEVQVMFPSTRGATRTFIDTIDGRSVASLNSPFELLPGCHVVGTAARASSTGSRYVTMPSSTATHTFVIPMVAGHDYTVVETWSMPYGPQSTLSVRAVERDATGAETQEFPAAITDADVQACRAWTPPLG
jgi:hypothetical protein